MQFKTLRCDVFEPTAPSGEAVVVLHGRGDSSAGFHWMPQIMRMPQVRWIMPNAPDDWFGGHSWYGMAPNHLPGIVRSRGLLDDFFAELEAQGQDLTKTVLFGFSQGCLLTLEWGGRTARPLAGFVGISGYCADVDALIEQRNPQAMRRPFFVSHGTEDDVLPCERTSRQMAALTAAGFNMDFRTYDKTHTIGPDLPDIRAAMVGMLGWER